MKIQIILQYMWPLLFDVVRSLYFELKLDSKKQFSLTVFKSANNQIPKYQDPE